MDIAVAVLLMVFVLTAVRQIGSLKLRIWQIMLSGALAVLLTGQISPAEALKAVNLDVMLFLFGVFVVGQALEESGYLSYLSYRLFRQAKTADQLMLFVLFGAGAASAFLMNDTLAVVGTPVVLLLADKHRISPKPLLLALAFGVTIGSVPSPIGNPQNLLISLDGNVANPFIAFIRYLLLPTLVSLLSAHALLKLLYRESFHSEILNHSPGFIEDRVLAGLSRASLILIVVLVLLRIVVISLNIDTGFDFRLTYIALVSALPVLLLSKKRIGIIRRIDWHTLIFFAAMFVLMESVWDSGFFQAQIESLNFGITSLAMILFVSIFLSQLISNVPLVALYMPMLISAGASTREMLALGAGSTIAGNLSILGAASNVIIIQNAEKKSGETLGFIEFVRAGLPITAANAIIYFIFLKFA